MVGYGTQATLSIRALGSSLTLSSVYSLSFFIAAVGSLEHLLRTLLSIQKVITFVLVLE